MWGPPGSGFNAECVTGTAYHQSNETETRIMTPDTLTRAKAALLKQREPKTMNIEIIAKACHEANKAYCEALGDTSQLPWSEAPEWQRTSAVAGVAFHRDNPEAGPEASHNSWLAEKETEGWQWGPVKDVGKKEHPCYVNYHELPESQKAKDSIFVAIVRGALAALDNN